MAEPCSAILPGCAREFGNIQASMAAATERREAMHADIKEICACIKGNGRNGYSSRITALEVANATKSRGSARLWEVLAVLTAIICGIGGLLIALAK